MAKLVHNVQKKQHRERSQLASRSRLGHLEKHKDYVLRAKDFHKKQDALKHLRNKAKERNPDEYYHAMHTRKTSARDGLLIASRHGRSDEDGSLSMDQVKLLKTQDSNYVRTLRQMELRKIQKSQPTLSVSAKNQHTVFVDTREEMSEFKPEKYFQTTKELLNKKENRLRVDQLQEQNSQFSATVPVPKHKLQNLRAIKHHIERERQLKQVEARMERERLGMTNGSKKKIVDPARNTITFKWKKQRKR